MIYRHGIWFPSFGMTVFLNVFRWEGLAVSFELRVLSLCSVGPFVVLGWRFYTLEKAVNQFRDLALQSPWAANILETTPLCAMCAWLSSLFRFHSAGIWNSVISAWVKRMLVIPLRVRSLAGTLIPGQRAAKSWNAKSHTMDSLLRLALLDLAKENCTIALFDVLFTADTVWRLMLLLHPLCFFMAWVRPLDLSNIPFH